MANYFRLDTSFLKDTNSGGRLYSAVYNAEIPNGFIGYLGGYVEGSTEVRTLLAPTAELVASATPVIVMKPEINYDESKRTSGALGIFRNPANKPVPAIMFNVGDGLDLSEDYFDKTGKGNGKIEVGDMFSIEANGTVGTQLKYTATKPADVKAYFRVIGVKDSHLATYVHSNGQRFPQPYKMVALEIVMQ